MVCLSEQCRTIFDERIEQKIFHAEIVVDNAAIARETKTYEKIPNILDFRDKDGNDTMQAEIEYNSVGKIYDTPTIFRRMAGSCILAFGCT